MAFVIFLFCFKQFCSVDSQFFVLGNVPSETYLLTEASFSFLEAVVLQYVKLSQIISAWNLLIVSTWFQFYSE